MLSGYVLYLDLSQFQIQQVTSMKGFGCDLMTLAIVLLSWSLTLGEPVSSVITQEERNEFTFCPATDAGEDD